MKCHKCHKETSETRRCPFCGASLSSPTTSWKRPVAESSTAGKAPAVTSAESSSMAGTAPATTSAESSSAEATADSTTAATVGGADRVKEAEYLAKFFHVRHTDGTIQGPFTGAVMQSLYKHRKLEPYWEISEDQQTWMVVERVPWLKRGFDGAKIGELAGKLGEKSVSLQRKAAPVVAELSRRASPLIERVKRSPKIALASAAIFIVLLCFLMWPTSNHFQGNWVGFAKMPLLGSEMVTATINGTTFTMTDEKSSSIIGRLEIIGEGEARLTGLFNDSNSANPKGANFDTGLVRLVGKDHLKITFLGTFLEVSLNKVK